MAANFNPTELKYLLECAICLNRFEDPRSLPCLHSYCLQCLKSHITSNREPEGAFECPQCRERCILPGGGAENFPKNFFVNAMTDVIPKQDDEESNLSKDQSPKCDLHDLKISWYCKTCSLPACPCCIIEKHHSHVTENVSIIEAAFKKDLFDVSNLASKRIDFLQKALADLDLSKMKMEEELDTASQIISEKSYRLHQLVSRHEATLQQKLKAARTKVRKHFAQAKKEIETANENSLSLRLCAEMLYQASPEQAICTVLQAPINKEQFLRQQDIPLPSVKWQLNKSATGADQPLTSISIGTVDVKTTTDISTKVWQEENVTLEAPVPKTKLKYKGKYSVCGIASIYKSKMCVAHYAEQCIWVYADGQFQKQIKMPGMDKITGMIAVDGNTGKLAILDNKQRKVHFVTLSQELEILQHVNKDISFMPRRISMNLKRQILVNISRTKKVAILNADGQLLSTIKLSIPHAEVAIESVVQTKSGLVVCDNKNKKTYFADASGNILHTHNDCKSTWHAAQISWGHVLVTDWLAHEIKVFSEGGEFLGNVHDQNDRITYPNCVCIDEAERLLYVGTGKVGKQEVRTYQFAPSDLEQLPVTRDITDVSVNVSLINV